MGMLLGSWIKEGFQGACLKRVREVGNSWSRSWGWWEDGLGESHMVASLWFQGCLKKKPLSCCRGFISRVTHSHQSQTAK